MKRKLTLPTTGLLVTALPVAFSVSCGQNNDGKRIQIDYPAKLKHNFEISNEASLSSKTIDYLSKLLSMSLNYGPESFLLKKIRLVDNGAIANLGEAGLFSESQTIAINTKILKSLDIKNEEDQALYLFELIYHEYMHFIADNYFNNTSEVSSIDCENPGNGETKEHWTSKFIEAFKKAFHYDVPSSNKESWDLIENKYVSIASKYDSKDIFDISNDSTKSFDLLKGNEVMASSRPSESLINFWETLRSPVITNSSLKYIYSMQELWARKGQLATSPIFATLDTSSNQGEGFNLEGWINLGQGKQFWSPILQDVLNFSDSLYGKNYLADSIDATTDYNPLFLSQFKDKNSISLLAYKNETTFNADGSLNKVVDHSQIAIGGYLPNPKFSYIGYTDNLHVFHGFKLNVENDYYLSSYIDASELISKELQFSKDENGSEVENITSIYKDFDNQVSSNRDFDASNEDYLISLDANGVAFLNK